MISTSYSYTVYFCLLVYEFHQDINIQSLKCFINMKFRNSFWFFFGRGKTTWLHEQVTGVNEVVMRWVSTAADRRFACHSYSRFVQTLIINLCFLSWQEGSCIISGLGYNGRSEDGGVRWDGCSNVHLLLFETAYTFQVFNQSLVTNDQLTNYPHKNETFLAEPLEEKGNATDNGCQGN